MSLIILELADILAATIIQKSAFTVSFILPLTYELYLNQIRCAFFVFLHLILELLDSGLFTFGKIVPISKGKRTLLPPAILEGPVERISVLVAKSAIKDLACNPISVEIAVVGGVIEIHGAIPMRFIKYAFTLI
jgi:hypothetical protein